MLLGTLGTSLLRNLLTVGKGMMRAGEGIVRAGDGIVRASEGSKKKSNIFRIQAYDSIMCGYFCIEFINYMLKGKTLLDYTILFSPNDFKKNDQIVKRIFKNE